MVGCYMETYKNVLISIETLQSDWLVMIETSYVERSLSVENAEASMGSVSFPNLSKKDFLKC